MNKGSRFYPRLMVDTTAIGTARAAARAAVWSLAGEHAPDHGADAGSGEPLAVLLRAGDAGSNTATGGCQLFCVRE